jgi:predicted nucleic acid-binding protein
LSGLVVDASVALSWLLKDEGTAIALSIRQRVIKRGAVVPVIWRSEVANGLLAAARRGRLSPEESLQALTDLSSLRIDTDLEGLDRIWNDTYVLAAEHRLTVYDAAYLELAARRALPLATFDVELRDAAATLGIEVQ